MSLPHAAARCAAFAALALLAIGPAAPARAQPVYFVNTTEDMQFFAGHCLPGQVCPFRSAIVKAQDIGAVVTACFEGAEGCPPTASPLTRGDAGYDSATDTWQIRFNEEDFRPFLLDKSGAKVDFTRYVPGGWQSPADTKIVLDTGTNITYNHMFLFDGGFDNQLAGFQVRGKFETAAILLRNGAQDNQFGPGLVLAGIGQGAGIRMTGAGTQGNVVVGIWCGLRGDGSIVDPVQDDCVQIQNGSTDNRIGGPAPEDRNVLSASAQGAGIRLEHDATRDNVIEGNYIGTDPSGTVARGNQSGIGIMEHASDTTIRGNLISGNVTQGIFAVNASTEFGRTSTELRDNTIGADASGDRPLGNGNCGVLLDGLSKDVEIGHNRIWFNEACGVSICGERTRNNTVTENSITQNGGAAIQVCSGANEGVEPPEIVSAIQTRANGTACPGCRVEVFSDLLDQAEVFEGAVVADDQGTWVLDNPEGFTHRRLTATSTDGLNTSGLSAVRVISRGTVEPSPTPGDTPTPTPTPTIGPSPTDAPTFSTVFLPVLSKDTILR
jgi:hypothetical protein